MDSMKSLMSIHFRVYELNQTETHHFKPQNNAKILLHGLITLSPRPNVPAMQNKGALIKIMETLSKYPNIRQMLTGKTIAGDSAGANALGKLFFSKNSKVIGTGLGILPLKIVPHYEDGTPNPLADVEPKLKTLLLREYEMKVIEVAS